jgi:hypothetical protein
MAVAVNNLVTLARYIGVFSVMGNWFSWLAIPTAPDQENELSPFITARTQLLTDLFFSTNSVIIDFIS